jgi:hypothetical protein
MSADCVVVVGEPAGKASSHVQPARRARPRAKRPRATLDQRVEAFRALVYEGIRKASKHGHAFKSYEGALSLQWPPFVREQLGQARYKLSLSCSVFGGDTNHYAWQGRSWAEVFRKASADVAVWTAEIGANQCAAN